MSQKYLLQVLFTLLFFSVPVLFCQTQDNTAYADAYKRFNIKANDLFIELEDVDTIEDLDNELRERELDNIEKSLSAHLNDISNMTLPEAFADIQQEYLKNIEGLRAFNRKVINLQEDASEAKDSLKILIAATHTYREGYEGIKKQFEEVFKKMDLKFPKDGTESLTNP